MELQPRGGSLSPPIPARLAIEEFMPLLTELGWDFLLVVAIDMAVLADLERRQFLLVIHSSVAGLRPAPPAPYQCYVGGYRVRDRLRTMA